MTLLATPYLRTADSDLDRMITQTHRGQAHFAGTGPAGTRCGGCEHFKPQWHRAADGRCFKVLPGAIKKRKNRHIFPASAETCRYFQPTNSEMDRGTDGARRGSVIRGSDNPEPRTTTSANTNRKHDMSSIRDEFPSQWLKPYDLPDEGCEATITGVAIEQFGKDKKIVLEFAEFPGKRKIVNTTGRRWLAETFGDDTRDWVRQHVYLHTTQAMSPTTHEMTDVIGIRLPRPPVRKPEPPAQPPAPRESGVSVRVMPNARTRAEAPPAEPSPPTSVYQDLDDAIPDEGPFAPEEVE